MTRPRRRATSPATSLAASLATEAWPTAVGLAAGFLVDRAVGDPRRGHPVAAFGTLAAAAERAWYAPSRARGVAHEAVLVGAVAALGTAADAVTRHRPVARTALTAAATWAVLGGRTLEREAGAIRDLLNADDLVGARQRLTHLVGRDPSRLSPDEVARACVESVAENSADAVVAPLFWGGVAGIPGLLTYRAINTMDAMVGHRSDRYREFGWAAARLDDLANVIPARLTVLLVAATHPSTERWRSIARAVREDAPAHPSPNAGPVEASFAAALNRQLGGENTYDGVVEDRGRLGDGPPVAVADVDRFVTALRRVSRAALASAVALAGASARLTAIPVGALTARR